MVFGRVVAHHRLAVLVLTAVFAVVAFQQVALAAGGPITSGDNFSGIITNQTDTWTFTANTGDAVDISASEVGINTSFQPWLQVLAPNSTLIVNQAGDLRAVGQFTASQTGTYTVLVKRLDATTAAGNYVLTFVKSPGLFSVPSGDEGGAMTNGGNYQGSILRGDLDPWSFDATANDSIDISVSELGTQTSFQPWIRVYAPNGTLVVNQAGSLRALGQFQATQTGTYNVVVLRLDANDGVGQYVLTFVKSPGTFIVPAGDEGGAMTNGGNYQGSILRGDLDPWSFQASAGDSVDITASEVGVDTSFQPWLRVYAPNGTLVVNQSGGLRALGQFQATQTGTYTAVVLRLDANDGVGQYVLTFVKSPGTFSVPSGDEGGAMTNGGNYQGSILRGDLDPWSFQATANDSIDISVSELGTQTSFQPWIRVYAPNGTLVVNQAGSLRALGQFQATQTGTYNVVVLRLDANDGVGQYMLTFVKSPGAFTFAPHGVFAVTQGDDGGPIVSGANYTGSILRGDLDPWSFAANAGDSVDISVSELGDDTPFQPWLRVYAPNGTLVVNQSGGLRALGQFAAPQTGTYTAVVLRLDANDGVGQYVLTFVKSPGTFTVHPGDDGGALTSGGNFTGSILRGDLDPWSFDANSGDSIDLSISEVGTLTSFQPWIRVYAPNGTLVVNQAGSLRALGQFRATQTGTYNVVVLRLDANDGVGQYVLSFVKSPGTFIVPSGDDGGPLVVGANAPGTILRGDLDPWRFQATTGDSVAITVVEVGPNTNFQPWIRVYRPDGILIGNAAGDVSASVSFTAPVSGTYNVVVLRLDANDGTGTYQLSSSNAGSASPGRVLSAPRGPAAGGVARRDD
jgi:archaeosine-15-forming tRNA-guanine transglycosylase